MIKKFVRLPIEKAYLYDLIRRYRIYLLINSGLISFGLTSREGVLINHILLAYGSGDERFKPRANRYDELIRLINEHIEIAKNEEIKIANKLSKVSNLNVKGLIMELKVVKAFAKEVGVKVSSNLDKMIIAILKKVEENEDAEYSAEFVEFYNEMPDKYFEMAEGVIDADDNKEDEASNTADDEPEDDEPEDDEPDDSDVDNAVSITDLIGELESAKNSDGLEDVLGEMLDDNEELFTNFEFPDTDDDEMIRQTMLDHLNGMLPDDEEPEAENDQDVDPDAAYEKYAAMKILALRKAAKEDFGIDTKGMKKADILENISAALTDMPNGEDDEQNDEDEVEITEELIKDAIEADDMETLAEIAELIEVKLNKLDHRSSKRMGDKILKKFAEMADDEPEDDDDEEPILGKAKKPADEQADEQAETRQSIFSTIEQMVLADVPLKEAVKKLSPVLMEQDMTKAVAKRHITALYRVAEIDKG